MNEKFESSNVNSKQSNDQMLAALDTQSSRSQRRICNSCSAHKVKVITDNFFNYIASLKEQAAL
jgi:hypothetical protein